VTFSSPEEKEIEDFLARQLQWVRRALRREPLSFEDMSALQQVGAFETLGEARDQYLVLLQQCPEKLRQYRDSEAEFALSQLPSLPSGRPREDRLALEATKLREAGFLPAAIARKLNDKYPDRTDRKGHMKPLTAGAVRKMLARRRQSTPDKT